MWLIVLSLTPKFTSGILLLLVYSCFDIVSPYSVVLSCYHKRSNFFLLRYPFLSNVQCFFTEVLLVCRLKYSCSCFSYHFLFPGYLYFVDASVDWIVSFFFNQSSAGLVCEIFQSLYRCIDAIFLLFLTYIACLRQLWDIKPNASSYVLRAGQARFYGIIFIIIIIIRAFYISNSRWFFTEVWVAASLLKSPGLFLVFWQFSTMLLFGWSPLTANLQVL